ncbi:hypothetical protein BABINDRAFT_34639 [Babjeviella inositovora NRRL Y-12698]|uniref:Ceramide very long chain fatty acid hydroxylase n=1 Tax=Babjeviella inositovora NRRL Y-12698 TaxID=984486 RepID=A0A1E3QSP7_9ASCO|nr:uncharacterized protein BABINDRAFT_34639 [Babjeviella inositovora NRRL Y-12698]ODQ80736.1 hypothetical protein BABINDRAFT_34639 [Babjeviella inositovora NRRL Y-12698]
MSKKAYTAKDVRSHNRSTDCWVTLGEKVYDVTEFLDAHPGGPELIMEYAGRDITDIMKDAASHIHSSSAYEMLDDEMCTGKLVEAAVEEQPDLTTFSNELPAFTSMVTDTDAENDFSKHKFMDLAQPLMPQILKSHWTRDFYLDQVHRPRHCSAGARIYPNPIMDNLFSKTPWWLILCYAPIPYFAYRAASALLPPDQLYGLFGSGFLVWSLVEYLLHRFIFHIDSLLPDYCPRAFALHFVIHGRHHFLPMDANRISASPILLTVFSTSLFFLLRIVTGKAAGMALFSGAFTGFMAYEEFHISLHTRPQWLQEMKRYHLQHHYKNFDLGYGVTTKIWDYAFGTVLDAEDESQVYSKKP